jgi:hypothetical protein
MPLKRGSLMQQLGFPVVAAELPCQAAFARALSSACRTIYPGNTPHRQRAAKRIVCAPAGRRSCVGVLVGHVERLVADDRPRDRHAGRAGGNLQHGTASRSAAAGNVIAAHDAPRRRNASSVHGLCRPVTRDMGAGGDAASSDAARPLDLRRRCGRESAGPDRTDRRRRERSLARRFASRRAFAGAVEWRCAALGRARGNGPASLRGRSRSVVAPAPNGRF